MSRVLRLIHARLEAGYMEQADFAKKIKISRTQYTRIENGHIGMPHPRTIYRMSRVLNIQPLLIMRWFYEKEFCMHKKLKKIWEKYQTLENSQG